MNGKNVNVLIAECIPSLNMGEMAIFLGMLKTFRLVGKVNVSIFSFLPSTDKKRYPNNVTAIDVCSELYLGDGLLSGQSRQNLFKNFVLPFVQHFSFAVLYKILGDKSLKIMQKNIWRQYCDSDVILICHDQVDCVNGFILLFSPVYLTFLAKAIGKPIVIYGNGTFHFNGVLKKFLALYVLNNVDLITARTNESYMYLKKFVLNKHRVYSTGDPAILLSSESSEKIEPLISQLNLNSATLYLGVVMSHEVLRCAFHKSDSYQKALITMANLFDRLIADFNISIVFIPHCIEPYENRDDRLVAAEIYNLMKNKNSANLLTKEYSSSELKGIMGRLDFFLSTRVHAAIGALSMGVPSIVLTRSFDRRAHALIGQNLKQEEWIYTIDNLDVDLLFKKIKQLLSSSTKLRQELPSVVKPAQKNALLNGMLLRTLLHNRYKRKVS